MSGSSTLLAALAGRRSYYALRRESPIPDSKIQSILNQIVLQTPSAFNSQTTRILAPSSGDFGRSYLNGHQGYEGSRIPQWSQSRIASVEVDSHSVPYL